MAATYPRPQPEPEDRRDRPELVSSPTTTPQRRSRWIAIAIGAVVVLAAAMILYFVLYSGGGSGGGGTPGGGGGGGGGGYVMLAFGADQARRLVSRFKRSR